VGSLGLDPNACTTQVEDHDGLAEYFGVVARINGILRDLDRDLWLYISHGDLVQKALDSEVGSSTMPHKVNPIRFENSEGNVAIANALLHALSEQLTRSRMQRDLSGTTVKRNIGVALAHSYLAVSETLQGLARIGVDEAALRKKVEAMPEVLAEAVQTILRTAGVEDPYELLRGLTRGEAVTLANLHAWIDALDVSEDVASRLKALRPEDYIGLAPEICERVVARARSWLGRSG
jgi:adenylosuccinate lyase